MEPTVRINRRREAVVGWSDSWSVLFHRGNRQEGWPAVTEREVLNFLAVRTGTVS